MRDEEFAAIKAAKKAEKRAKKEAAGKELAPSKRQKKETAATEQEGTTEAPVVKVPPTPEKAPVNTETAPVSKEKSTAEKAPATADSGFCDQWLACSECTAEFLYSASEQKFFHEKGFSAKSRCSECTAAKKARFNEASGKGTAAKERAARTTCYTCGQVGHSSKECKEAPCYNCGEKGHKSKDCKAPRMNQAGGGVCFKFQSGSCTRGEACRFAHVKE